MKTRKKIILMFYTIVSIFYGCDKQDSEKEQLIINLEETFNEDLVKINIDNKTVFSETVNTNHSLGLAKGILLDYPLGDTELTISIGNVVKKVQFVHKKNRYITIGFDKSNSEININYPVVRPLYD